MAPMGSLFSRIHHLNDGGQQNQTNKNAYNTGSLCPGRSYSNGTNASGASSSRRMSQASDLKLGSLTKTWKDRREWTKFCNYLNTMDEGTDSEGQKMSLHRYAKFLELYVELDQAERVQGRSDADLLDLVLKIRNHEEDFFGTERCLRCIDGGMRRQVLDNVKKVRKKEVKAGTWVFQPAYSRVFDYLNELHGSFNKTELQKQSKK